MERKPARYAHAEGHTDVLYTKDGSELLTCGSDGDVRIWAGLEDDDPKSVCVGEWALSISLLDDRLFVSTDNHAVQIYTFPGFDKDGIVTRFTAPVTHITTSVKNSNLVCCSENTETRLCSKEENKWKTQMMAHQGPVLGVAVCPLGKHCVTSCGDGLYRIWNLSDCTLIKELPGIPKANSFYAAKILGRASFEPLTGKLLAYPSNKELLILDTKTWQQKFILNNSQINSALSICLFSPCGKYLAASSISGQIIIWNINEQTCTGITEHPSSLNISSMAWNPSGNGELALCDVSGQLSAINNCYGNIIDDEDPNEMDENLDLIDIIEKEKENGENELEYPESEDDDDDDENTISLRKLKKETLGLTQNNDNGAGGRSRSHSRSRSRSPKRPQIENVPAQPPFQPSSTPINLEHRYMCWNEVGIVRCHTVDDNSNIEVEFHDSATHHGIHLNNHLNHTLASLSTTVLVLACEAPSKIVCISLIGGSKEWSVTLGELEEVLCIVATDTLVAAATSSRLLRLYTTFGTQLHVVSILGPPICLAGRKGILNIVYHASNPGLQDQNIATDSILVKGTKVSCRRAGIRIPLAIGGRLQWFGVTDQGSPVSLDSSGILNLYDFATNFWVPICDTTSFYKGVSDTYFIISVNESMQFASTILCRGTQYPPTAPRPISTNLPLRLPLCEMETEKGQHEELFRRSAILRNSNNDQTKIEIVLKLFALACRSEIEYRAIEIVELLHDHQIAILAARYASRLGKLHLADKLTNLAESWKVEVTEPEVIENQEEANTPDAVENESDDDLNSSIILPVGKKRSELAPLKPMPFLRSSQGSKNPFRLSKNSEKENSSSPQNNPLSLTDRTLVTEENSKATPLEKTVSSPLQSEQFPQWFARNKEALEKEHANLTPSELTKTGIRLFKSLRSQSNELTPKRKHSPEPEDTSTESKITAPKQSKLAAFAFQRQNK